MNRWVWIAYYNDGTIIRQNEFNEATGRDWSTDHLDPERLKHFTLEPEFSDWRGQKQPRIVVETSKGTKFKRFWRRYSTGIVTRKYTGEKGEDGEEKFTEDVEMIEATTWVIELEKDGVTFYNFFRPNGEWVLSFNPEGSELETW